MRRSLFALFLCVAAYSIDIDIHSLQLRLQKQPDDLQTLLLLARYHLDHDQIQKAKEYLQKAISYDPDNPMVLKLHNKLTLIELKNTLVKRYGSLAKAIAALEQKGEHEKILSLLPLLDLHSLDPATLAKIAIAAAKKGEHKLAKKLQNLIPKDRTALHHQITAQICIAKNDFVCAQKALEALAKDENPTYIKELLELYARQKDLAGYKRLLAALKRQHPADPDIFRYEKKALTLTQKLHKKELERFFADPTLPHLKQLAFRLYPTDPYKVFDLFRHYFKHHPDDDEALIFFAQLSTWRGDVELPDDLITKVAHSKNYKAKLLVGKALSWQGEYKRALPFLLEVLQKGKNKDRYEAKKAIAFIYKWQNKDEKAKKLFEELYAQNPHDQEVKETLEVMRGDVQKWIEHYKKALQKEPNNPKYLLKLAQYYRLTGDLKESVSYYERYLQLRPDDLETYRFLGELYLQLGEKKRGFGYLEYWAGASAKAESALELAKKYEGWGHYKEALEVLQELLVRHPEHEEARKLKAKILQRFPRITKSQPPLPQNLNVDISGYFQKIANKTLAFANRLYDEGHYKGSLDYFRRYLQIEPDDMSAKERYAYALEYAGEYERAAAEFYLLLTAKDDPIWRYHYAFNLAKTGKVEEAKKILYELKASLPKPLPQFLRSFLEEWKDAWQKGDFERYIQLYDKSVFGKKWSRKKRRSLQKKPIHIQIQTPLFISRTDSTYTVRFYQIYTSPRYSDKGYKTLKIRCKKGCKIVSERWQKASYNRLKDIKKLGDYIDKLLQDLSYPAPKKVLLPQDIHKDLQDPEAILNILHLQKAKKKTILAASTSSQIPGRSLHTAQEVHCFFSMTTSTPQCAKESCGPQNESQKRATLHSVTASMS